MTIQEYAWLAPVAMVLLVGGALAGYITGRDPGRRRHVVRMLAGPASLVTALVLVAAGALAAWIVPASPAVSRRYAEYLPPATGAWHNVLAWAALLLAAGLLLLAGWASARSAGAGPQRIHWWRRHAVGVAGALVAVAGAAVWYLNRWNPPAAFGWFMYSPLRRDHGADLRGRSEHRRPRTRRCRARARRRLRGPRLRRRRQPPPGQGRQAGMTSTRRERTGPSERRAPSERPARPNGRCRSRPARSRTEGGPGVTAVQLAVGARPSVCGRRAVPRGGGYS